MPIDPGVIRTPLHVHGARTAAEYQRVQENQMRFLRSRGLNAQIWVNPDARQVFITGGTWVVFCNSVFDCSNAPTVSPEFNVARCLDCGAIYQNLVWQDRKDEVPPVLLVRPIRNRSWGHLLGDFTVEYETIERLKEENVENGLPETKPGL